MTHGSLFTGVGGIDLGFDAAGIRTLWQCEQDKRCQSILRRHWPKAELYGDVADLNGAELKPVDIITFGSPCQDLSVAGKRQGMKKGTRSSLYYEATRIIREMQEATDGKYPQYAIWENVRGALTSREGRDFQKALEELANLGALDIAWRVVNTCHFGPPQRRVRVFVVADFRGRRAGEILSQPTRVLWHPAEGGEEGQETAGRTGNSITGSQWRGTRNVASSILNNSGGICVPEAQAGQLVVATAAGGSELLWARKISLAVTAKWAKGTGGPSGDETQNLVYIKSIYPGTDKTVANCISAELYHRGTVVNQDAINGHLVIEKQDSAAVIDGHNQTTDTEVHPPLHSHKDSGDSVLIPGYRVRRLTPRECERLQGWPDDHTRYTDTGVELKNEPRFKMIGNGVSAPVAQWLGENIANSRSR